MKGKYIMPCLMLILLLAACTDGLSQYYSQKQSTLLTNPRKPNPKFRTEKKAKKMSYKRQVEKIEAQKTILVTGAGNPDLAKKKIGWAEGNIREESYNKPMDKTRPVEYKNQTPTTAFEKNYYKVERKRGRKN